jgi:hypothetical protein
VGAAVLRTLPPLTAAIEQNPAAGEPVLAQLVGKRALPRGIRLALMHRWAVLRHRQERYGESAAIAQTLLRLPRLGLAGPPRAHLLLMLVEARLELREPGGAWPGLCELARTPLSLHEALQRLGLQTRYQVMVGQDAAALHQLREKVALAELMPAAPCGAFHALLATAAERLGRENDRRWLRERVELLCTAEQIEALGRGGYTV